MRPGRTDIKIETTGTLDALFHQILNQALVAVGAEAGSLMLVDNKRGILHIKARLGKPRPGRRRDPVYSVAEKRIASCAVRNKEAYLCRDVDADPNFTPSSSGTKYQSVLSVPVVHGGTVLAVINADAEAANYFDETSKETLQHLAEQVASPIAERVSLLEALTRAGLEVSRLPGEGSLEGVLKKIAQFAVRSLGADVVTIYPYVQSRDEFPVEGMGPTIYPEVLYPGPMRRKVHPGDVPWTVVKERKPGFYADVQEADFLTRDVERPGEEARPRFVEREGIKSMAALLLPYRAAEFPDEEVVGVMFANYRFRHEFNIDETSALATFADYAAAAILNARREQQRRAEQMRLAQSISLNLAHRMGNLAGAGRLAAQVLKDRVELDDKLALRQLDTIILQSDVLFGLVDRIKEAFKETGSVFDLAPIDVGAVLDEVLERLGPDLGEVTVKKDVRPNLPKVQSVDFQLRQVLHDIIYNGIEALSGRESATLTIRVRVDRQASRVIVEISDNGPGIRENVRANLFALGVSSKERRLGFGLWWCRTFMRATGGDLLLQDSQPGEGATFVVTIPCASGSPDVSEQELPTLDILVVDDDERFAKTLTDALAGQNYTVETAGNYAGALQALHRSAFRLAVVDIRLVDSDEGNKDGLRLLAEMDRAGLDGKVIIVTGHGTKEDEEVASYSARLQGFFHKQNLDLKKFRDKVYEVVRGATPEAVAR